MGESHPHVVDTQTVKQQKPGRLQTVTQRVWCGSARLAPCGLASSTSVMERLPLTRRHARAPLVSKRGSFGTDREQMRRRIVFFHAFDNFARPHQSLRAALRGREAT